MNISQLLTPIGATVAASEPLTHAAKLVGDRDRGYVTVLRGPEDSTPLGVITDGDLSRIKLKRPTQWPLMTCQSALNGRSRLLRPETGVDDVVEVFSTSGVRPLLVGAHGSPVSVLEPGSIFQWCAEHSPSSLEKLAYLISAEERTRAQA